MTIAASTDGLREFFFSSDHDLWWCGIRIRVRVAHVMVRVHRDLGYRGKRWLGASVVVAQRGGGGGTTKEGIEELGWVGAASEDGQWVCRRVVGGGDWRHDKGKNGGVRLGGGYGDDG